MTRYPWIRPSEWMQSRRRKPSSDVDGDEPKSWLEHTVYLLVLTASTTLIVLYDPNHIERHRNQQVERKPCMSHHLSRLLPNVPEFILDPSPQALLIASIAYAVAFNAIYRIHEDDRYHGRFILTGIMAAILMALPHPTSIVNWAPGMVTVAIYLSILCHYVYRPWRTVPSLGADTSDSGSSLPEKKMVVDC